MPLIARNLVAGYGDLRVLNGVSIEVGNSEIVGLLGPNGAGKTTLVRALAGILSFSQGSILLDDTDFRNTGPHARVRCGLAIVPEGRGLFGSLTVEENLVLGDRGRRTGSESVQLEEVYELFPALKDRPRQRAETLSGGEQQMLAIARAMRLRPRYLLLDEPSTGLAPMIADQVFESVRTIAKQGIGTLLVEQDVRAAMNYADRIVVLASGSTVLRQSREAFDKTVIARAYLGASSSVQTREG